MELKETVEKIEEVVSLLGMFGSKRKPLIKRKFVVTNTKCTMVHIAVGYDEIGRYAVKKGEEDTYFKDWDTTKLPMLQTNEYFHSRIEGREKDMYVLPILKHLRSINKYKGMSKPSKKDLIKTKYKNKAFVMDGEDFLELVGKGFPSKKDLLSQKVYLHVRDTCTNSMLMSKDFDIKPSHLNSLIDEVISMNPHLVRDLNIDFYEFEEESNLLASRPQVRPASKVTEYTAFRSYFTIKEALYAKIVSSMSKSNDILTSFKRDKVTTQYIEAFIKLKEHLSDAGYSSKEIEDAMTKRQGETIFLKLAMFKLLINEEGALPRHEASLFNHINHKLEIHAIKKDKDNNRNNKDFHLQTSLAYVERKVLNVISECGKKGVEPLLATGVVISYLGTMDLVKRNSPPIKPFIDELIKTPNIEKELDALINTNPYKTKPLPKRDLKILKQ